METKEIEDLVIRSLKEVVEVHDILIDSPLDSGTRLFGQKGVLKSIELVSLIVDLEEKIEDEYGISLVLADERAVSQKRSPFRSVTSLAEYICKLLDEMRQRERSSSQAV
jgi:acyl carrier protein